MSRTRWPRSVGDRGLKEFGAFTDSYGAQVRVQTSSSAEGPHVWVFIEGGTTEGEQRKNDGSAHLTMRQAEYLRAALDRWLASLTRALTPRRG